MNINFVSAEAILYHFTCGDGMGRSVGFDKHIRTRDYHYPVGIAKISVSLSTVRMDRMRTEQRARCPFLIANSF